MKHNNRTLDEYPLPWSVVPDGRAPGFATVFAANGAPVPYLMDIELGWTDTSTGAYQDPEQAYDDLCRIIATVNSVERLRPSKSITIALRLLALPFIAGLLCIALVRDLVIHAYRFLRYGGEHIIYPTPRDRIASVYELLERQLDNKKPA